MQILVTGANGFIGHTLCLEAMVCGLAVRGVTRTSCKFPNGIESFSVGNIDANCDWSDAFVGCEAVVHLAARVHVMQETIADPIDEFRKINVQGSLNLARQAAAAGIKRFIFISSIKVNGEHTELANPFTEAVSSAPIDPYGLSKYEAELALQQLAKETGMEVVIIRPPLIYGAGVKGNFATLARIVSKGLPLPLGSIHNKRTMVGIDNLISLIITCIDHPAAANQVFLAGDAEDLSTSDLLRRVAKAMNKPSRLIPVPQSWLTLAATVLGKKAVAQRLFGSLQLDISKARNLLGWEPPISVDEGLRRCFVKDQTTQ